MNANPVINNFSYCLAHVPDLVRYGSKPRREISKDRAVESELTRWLRPFARAAAYPPNQVFVGNLDPSQLASIPQPWFRFEGSEEGRRQTVGAFGEIIPQDLFYAILKRADVLEPPLFEIADESAELFLRELDEHQLFDVGEHGDFRSAPMSAIRRELEDGVVLPIVASETLRGCFRGDQRAEGREDENLAPHDLIENLSTKASGALALKWLFKRAGIGPDQVDFLISCGEEACGDRYQRGGGGMAKAIGEMCGCVNASGMDVKNFCAAPASAIVTAGALVKAGVYQRVVVVAGGSLAKLGMKFQAFVRHQRPILDDCLASMAFLITPNDGYSPLLHLEAGAVGLASIGSSTSDEAVYRRLILDVLAALGLKMTDVDKYAAELHNPEIMEHSGAGDVVKKNYRTIAALAVLDRQIEKQEMSSFIDRIGMPGFAPTQGHIPSAVPYIGHASTAMSAGRLRRAMFVCKASLFLNRITELYDGVSFLLEANPSQNQ